MAPSSWVCPSAPPLILGRIARRPLPVLSPPPLSRQRGALPTPPVPLLPSPPAAPRLGTPLGKSMFHRASRPRRRPCLRRRSSVPTPPTGGAPSRPGGADGQTAAQSRELMCLGSTRADPIDSRCDSVGNSPLPPFRRSGLIRLGPVRSGSMMFWLMVIQAVVIASR